MDGTSGGVALELDIIVPGTSINQCLLTAEWRAQRGDDAFNYPRLLDLPHWASVRLIVGRAWMVNRLITAVR